MTRRASRSGGRRRIRTVWCLAVLLLGICTGPAAADVQGVCDRARDLTTAGQPRQALALLERLDESDAADACVAEERTVAVNRIGTADLFVRYAATRPKDVEVDPEASSVCPAAPGEQATTDEWLMAARTCDAENEDAAATSVSQDAESQLRRAVVQHVQPWEYGALALLTVLVVGAVVARLLQRVIPVAWSWWRLPALWLRQAVVVAWTAFVVASGLLVLSALEEPVFGLPVVEVPVAAGLWVLAVLALSWASARRMRLLLTVRRAPSEPGESIEDKVATGHVLALIGELGSESPRGLEAVVGTDVTALSAAGLESAPQGKLASAVFQLLQVVWRQAPWEVTVSVVSEDLHTVHISRNGRHVRSAVVDRHSLGLGGVVLDPDGSATERRPDLHRMTAAVVLCTLQEAYRFAGLGGATSWRSVGLQYIATTDHPRQPAEWELLARAVNDDPGNKAALLALWHARYRNSKDAGELKTYVELLEDYLTREHGPPKAYVQAGENGAPAVEVLPPRKGEAALLMRALYAVAVAKVNWAFATGSDQRPHEAVHYLECLRRLIKAQLRSNAEAGALARRLQDPVDTMLRKQPDISPITPVAHYQHACHLGSRPALTEYLDNPTRALQHLWLADADPDLAWWRARDPQLGELRELEPYRRVYGRAAVTDMLESPAFAPFADRLRLMRVTEPEHVLAEQEHGTLAGSLGTTPAVASTLAEVALLIHLVPKELPQCEVADALWSEGVRKVRPGWMPDLVEPVLERLRPLWLDTPLQEDVLRRWLAGPTSTRVRQPAMNGSRRSS